jgi:hypothetical protein
MSLTDAQRLKFHVLANGISISDDCGSTLVEANRNRPLTPADYASTTGLILRLNDQVWVNAPISTYNPNFVGGSPFTLAKADNGLVLSGKGLSSRAAVWLPPDYHGRPAPGGRPWNDFVFTHGDRARLAPIGGCAMACKFCNIPYEDPYVTKPLDLLIGAVRRALEDPLQPARHLLISGGTPRVGDVPYLRDVYRRVLIEFPDIEVDIMMVPIDGLFDLEELRDLGVHELSINIEVFDPNEARRLMPHKYRQGLDYYLRFIERAAAVLGPGRVRSMLMIGLEDAPSALGGVRAIVDAGGVPVLSPFRPDPATPLRDRLPLAADVAERVFLDARAIARAAGSDLGPDCPPCTHNTLALVDGDPASVTAAHEVALLT